MSFEVCSDCNNSDLCSKLLRSATQVSEVSLALAKVANIPESIDSLPSFMTVATGNKSLEYLNRVVETQWAMGCSFSTQEILTRIEQQFEEGIYG